MSRVLLISLLLVGPIGCRSPEQSDREQRCQEACANFEACGQLPSVLGSRVGSVTAQQNCAARCMASGAMGDRLRDCGLGATATGTLADWCPNSTTATCRSVVECLARRIGDPETSVAIRLGDGSDGAARAQRPECDPSRIVCPEVRPEGDAPLPRLSYDALCVERGVDRVTFLVDDARVRVDGSRPGEPISIACPDIVGRSFALIGGGVGAVVFGAKLEGSLVDSASATRRPFCIRVYADWHVSEACGSSVVVAVPSADEIESWPTRCEESPSDCHDGEDQDQDGLVDCLDSDCTLWCGEERCFGDYDEDGDGLVDCLDPDCFESPSCPEAGAPAGVDGGVGS